MIRLGSPCTRSWRACVPLLLLLAVLLPQTSEARPRSPRAAGEDVAVARTQRKRAAAEAIAVEAWGEAAFARARRERRLVLIDGAAAWCHWCHVMEETTWRDPAIVALVRQRFVFVRFDVDERPDLGDRYEATGWPATIVLGPDGDELGREKGFLPADQALPLLEAAVRRVEQTAAGTGGTATASGGGHEEPRASVESLPWIAGLLTRTMDDAYDDEHGGWGRRKFPRPGNVLFELARAAAGDKAALERAKAALRAHGRLVDPVWGGIWKGNANADWSDPHVEKQTIYQGPNLEAFARGYAVTGDAALLGHARAIERYLAGFLTAPAPAGGFYTAQDADVGAHDPQARFVDGVTYYHRDDARRRRAGMPWIDRHIYARENGLALVGMAALHRCAPDPAVLARARRAAQFLIEKTVTADGSVEHDAERPTGRFFLADAAALGLGLLRLGEAAGDPALRATARRIAEAMVRNFRDPSSGALWDSTVDEGAMGVFARRNTPLEPAVWAARLLAGLGRAAEREPAPAAEAGDASRTPARHDESARYHTLGLAALAAAATPSAIRAQGPVVGELLLAIEELEAAHSPSP